MGPSTSSIDPTCPRAFTTGASGRTVVGENSHAGAMAIRGRSGSRRPLPPAVPPPPPPPPPARLPPQLRPSINQSSRSIESTHPPTNQPIDQKSRSIRNPDRSEIPIRNRPQGFRGGEGKGRAREPGGPLRNP